MTLGDALSVAILGAFALIGVMGGLRWVGRLLLGLALGCVVLVALAYAGAVPVIGHVGDTLSDGHVTPALLRHTEAAREWIEWYENGYEDDWPEDADAPAADTDPPTRVAL